MDAPSFYECTSLKKIQQKSHDSKITWISIAAGLFSFFVLFIGNFDCILYFSQILISLSLSYFEYILGILYALHRRNVRQTKKLEEMNKIKLKHIHQTEGNGNREILLGHEKT